MIYVVSKYLSISVAVVFTDVLVGPRLNAIVDGNGQYRTFMSKSHWQIIHVIQEGSGHKMP